MFECENITVDVLKIIKLHHSHCHLQQFCSIFCFWKFHWTCRL